MISLRKLALAAMVPAVPMVAAATKDRQAPPPAAIEDVVRCRALADDAARLRCFDGAADRLNAAVARKDVYVLDRAEVRETRRSLFGLPLPRQGVISDEPDERVAIDHIESTVARASQTGDGNWLVTLEQGGTWQQTDGYSLAHGPRKGDRITINRAALGSFKMKVLNQAAVRVRRVS